MLGGAEELAKAAIELRSKAGRGGSKASQSARSKRLSQFAQEIEKLGDLYPRISEQVILDQAFRNAVEADGEPWKQGRGQQHAYEIELRSSPSFRRRYFAIFSKTA